MADDERRSSKRSRFDQTERSSRFDRRSRSPAERKADSRRSRSPVAPKASFSPPEEKRGSADPAAAAGKSIKKHYT